MKFVGFGPYRLFRRRLMFSNATGGNEARLGWKTVWVFLKTGRLVSYRKGGQFFDHVCVRLLSWRVNSEFSRLVLVFRRVKVGENITGPGLSEWTHVPPFLLFLLHRRGSGFCESTGGRTGTVFVCGIV